jgi:polyferredoxin
MNKIKTRQKLRKGILFFSLLFFPITLNYYSPYLSLVGAMNGILGGAVALFVLQFLSSLFLGRAFCGWICAGGAVQSCAMHMVQNKKGPNGKANWIKYFIWAPWLTIMVISFIKVGGINSVDILWRTANGISVYAPFMYFIYIPILLLIAVPSFIWGRRTMCHTICWMAPFMIMGRKIRNYFKWPSLRLTADKDSCIACKRCSQVCTMSLPVQEMVQNSRPENSECILCLECVEVCNPQAIKVTFKSGLK